MRKRRFVRDDSRVHESAGHNVDVACHNHKQLRKRVQRFCNTYFVDPDNVLVGIRNLGVVEVVVMEIGKCGAAVLMGRYVAVSNGGVMVGRIRLVHVFRRERC